MHNFQSVQKRDILGRGGNDIGDICENNVKNSLCQIDCKNMSVKEKVMYK